jgi:histidine triad (HIT) family protein
MDKCRFCEIVEREHPADIIFEDDLVVAFLDHVPLTPGHSLVIPRVHFPNMLDVPAPMLAGIFSRVQNIARATKSAVSAEGMLIVSNATIQQTVPHFHVHIVPRWQDDGVMGFCGPRVDPGETQSIARQIRELLRR